MPARLRDPGWRPELAEPRLAQLAEGGRLIAPVGGADQELVRVERTRDGFTEKRLDAVKFVPLRGGKQ